MQKQVAELQSKYQQALQEKDKQLVLSAKESKAAHEQELAKLSTQFQEWKSSYTHSVQQQVAQDKNLLNSRLNQQQQEHSLLLKSKEEQIKINADLFSKEKEKNQQLSQQVSELNKRLESTERQNLALRSQKNKQEPLNYQKSQGQAEYYRQQFQAEVQSSQLLR